MLGKKSPSRGEVIKAIRAGKVVPVRLPRKIQKHTAPDWLISGLAEHDKRHAQDAWKGYRNHAMRDGSMGSLLLMPVDWVARKAFGLRRARVGQWHYGVKPALYIDTQIGKVLQKLPFGKTLFTSKEKIPIAKGLEREVSRASATAPFGKVRDVAETLAIGVGLEKGIQALTKRPEEDQEMPQALREKVASAMLQIHEENKGHKKRAHAVKLLYKQAEMGMERLPQSYGEFEEKLASLLNQDLVVLEKALELNGGSLKLGELGRDDLSSPMSATEQFQAAVLGEES